MELNIMENNTPTKSKEETNSLIDVFMGIPQTPFYVRNYHSTWALLMPVIEKISRLQKWNCEKCYDNLYPVTFGMINEETNKPMFRFNRFCVHESEILLDAAYEAVIEVIEYYYSHLEEFKSK
jgi:hypothetical protein